MPLRIESRHIERDNFMPMKLGWQLSQLIMGIDALHCQQYSTRATQASR